MNICSKLKTKLFKKFNKIKKLKLHSCLKISIGSK